MPILTADELIGTRIAGKCRLDRLIGRGGMGMVFAGVHEWTDREVALKLLNPEHVRDRDVVRRFLQEAKAAAQLEHPNVVDVLDMGRDEDETVYLVLELLKGRSLADLLKKKKRIEPKLACEILLPIMSALAVAHGRGIIHRDLKPDNIFLSRNSDDELVPKLLDFGIAKIIQAGTNATKTGSLIGTPQYMSPEQASATSEVGPAADVWSMGVVLFKCVTGRLPFEMPNPMALLIAIVTQEPPRVLDIDPGVPPALASCIDQALKSDLAERHETMRGFIEAVQEALRSEGIVVELRRSFAAIDPAEVTSEPTGIPESTRASNTTSLGQTPDFVEPTASTVGSRGHDADKIETEVDAPLPSSAVATPLLSAAPSRAPWIAVAVALLAVLGAVAYAFSSGTPAPSVDASTTLPAEPAVEEPPIIEEPEPEEPAGGPAALAPEASPTVAEEEATAGPVAPVTTAHRAAASPGRRQSTSVQNREETAPETEGDDSDEAESATRLMNTW